MVVAAMALLIPMIAAINYGWDAIVDAPWAYTVWHRQALTGNWLGQTTAASGEKFAVYLKLQRAKLANGQPQDEEAQGSLMAGQARWCDNRGRHADGILIAGAVPRFSGYNGTANNVDLSLKTAGDWQLGIQPDSFKGTWQLDTLTVQPSFVEWMGIVSKYSSDPTSMVFGKANESAYRAACAALGTVLP